MAPIAALLPAQDGALPGAKGESAEGVRSGFGASNHPEVGAGGGESGPGTTSGGSVMEKPVFLAVLGPAEIRKFYPPEAREEGIEGVVRLRLSIDQSGAVTDAIALNDPGHGFAEAARARMLRERFRPATVNGTPGATQIVFTVAFQEED